MEWNDIIRKAMKIDNPDLIADSYNSPIELIEGQLHTEIEDNVIRVVQEMCVNVDKEELFRALRYDRDQYEKGYNAGYMHRELEIVRCKYCKHKPKESPGSKCANSLEFPDDVCPFQCDDPWYSMKPEDYFFCAKGERRSKNERL